MKRPTHRDIARLAKVTHVTVSLALRAHRSIPKVTRDRIEKIAQQIGYRPDPALSALMVYRRGASPSNYQGTLAWINSYEINPDNLISDFSEYRFGAQQRCVELGYQIEEFRMTQLEMNFSRLSKVLRARNIQGLLFPPQDKRKHITRIGFDWANYAVIAFGFSLLRPQLDLVTNAQFRSTRLALRKLRSLGYRRIGFVTEAQFIERTDQNFLAGYLIEQLRLSASQRMPVYFVPKKSETERREGFRKWVCRHKPEAILFVNGGTARWLQTMSPSEHNGCGVALMDVPEGDAVNSGINQNNRIIGRTAVDMLIAKIHANDRGIPATPRRILIEGQWMPGKTAPRINIK